MRGLTGLTLGDQALIGGSFNPLTAVVPLHAGWASDPLWTPPANGSPVTSWRNQSGGGDPANGVAGRQPTFRSSTAAFNNRPTVQFDGNDILFFDITDIPQPYKFVLVGSITATGVFLGGAVAGTGVGRSAGTWYMSAVTPITGGTADNNPHSFVGVFNGASSRLDVDGASGTVSGNANTGAMSFLFLGESASSTLPMTGHLAFWGIYSNATPDASLAALATGLRNFYAIP